MIEIVTIILLMLISGTLGRMGGAGKEGQWYEDILDTKWRDLGCAIVLLAAVWLLFGFKPAYWPAYAITFLLTFGSFCTYWDDLFGCDCHWFSGLVVGLAAIPLMWVDPVFILLVPVRAIALAFWWDFLNKKLPQEWVLCWRRDVAEEFLRYAITL